MPTGLDARSALSPGQRHRGPQRTRWRIAQSRIHSGPLAMPDAL